MTSPAHLRPRRRRLPLAIIAAATLAASIVGLAGASSALGAIPACTGKCASWWHMTISTAPTHVVPGHEAVLAVSATNLGDAPIVASPTKEVKLRVELPPGLELIGLRPEICSNAGQRRTNSAARATRTMARRRCRRSHATRRRCRARSPKRSNRRKRSQPRCHGRVPASDDSDQASPSRARRSGHRPSAEEGTITRTASSRSTSPKNRFRSG